MGDDTGKKTDGINDPLTQTGTPAPQIKWRGEDEEAAEENDDNDKEA